MATAIYLLSGVWRHESLQPNKFALLSNYQDIFDRSELPHPVLIPRCTSIRHLKHFYNDFPPNKQYNIFILFANTRNAHGMRGSTACRSINLGNERERELWILIEWMAGWLDEWAAIKASYSYIKLNQVQRETRTGPFRSSFVISTWAAARGESQSQSRGSVS